jgi:cytochrome d ubiquinol oxidase subunit I
VIALWCGWIVTEVGRQPWIVHGYQRTSEAVTNAQGLWFVFALSMLIYLGLGVSAAVVLRAMSRRWREQDESEQPGPYGPPAEAGSKGGSG